MQEKTLILLLLIATVVHAAPKTDWEYYQKSGHRSPAWDSLVEAGFGAFDGQNFNASQSFLERAKLLGSRDGLVSLKLALLKEAQGNFPEAIKILQQAEASLRKSYPKHPATLEFSEHLGRLFYQTGKYEEALSHFLTAIQAQGETFLRVYLVGQIYRMKKELKEAITYFEKALQYEVPKDSPPQMRQLAQLELMKLYFEDREYDKALEMANQVLQMEPYNPTALSYRDQITQRKYKQKEREVLKRVIEGQ